MADKSINGWEVITTRADKRLKMLVVPGTNVKITMHKDVVALFAALAVDWHNTVAPLRNGETAGYAFRKARQANFYSDHSSGTAIDINWGHEGAMGAKGGMATMNAKQIAACAAIKKKYEIVIWGGDAARGGDYKSQKSWDPMHYALKPGTTVAQIQAVMKKLGIDATGARTGAKAVTKPAVPTSAIHEEYPGKQFSLGANAPYVKRIQIALGMKPANGIFNDATKAAVVAFQKKNPSVGAADGIVGPNTWKALIG